MAFGTLLYGHLYAFFKFRQYTDKQYINDDYINHQFNVLWTTILQHRLAPIATWIRQYGHLGGIVNSRIICLQRVQYILG